MYAPGGGAAAFSESAWAIAQALASRHVCLFPQLLDALFDQLLCLLNRDSSDTVAEILRNVKLAVFPDHADTRDIKFRAEQVIAMRWRGHQRLMRLVSVRCERNILARAVKMKR
jgi:hypothetical protein